MLEVGQPGELPLMRELTALKKTRCLRDPSTVSSWKSPVFGATSLNAELNFPMERLDADEGAGKDDPRMEHFVGGSVRRDGGRGTVSRGSFRSPQLNDVDPRLSWDLGRGTFFGMDEAATDLRQREQLRNHLEKVGVLGEPRGWGRQIGGKPRVHNWKAADCVADLEGGNSVAAESFGKREKDPPEFVIRRHSPTDAFRRDRSRPDSRDQGAFENHAESKIPAPFHEEIGRMNVSRRTSRMAKNGDIYNSRYSSQILSPLILSSQDDTQKFSQSQSLFTLEEPYNDEEQYLEEEFLNEMATVQREVSSLKVGAKSQSPLVPNDARRSSKKQTSDTNTRSSPVITPADNITQRIQSLRPAPWEAELLDYEVDELELLRKDGGKFYQRSGNQRQVKNLPAGHDRILASDFKRVFRREGGADQRQSELQQGFASTPFPRRSSAPRRGQEIEPLPVLTELEDYSGSDEFPESSVDGDCGRLSTSELHGELELEAFNAQDGHHGGRLVEVANTEGLQLAVPESRELALLEDRPRNLSQKYRPKAFEEIVGQNIVSQALTNAILKGKIAPVYLFQGSRGTGKTSAARIFAAALICISPEEKRPCGRCRECLTVASGKCSEVKEVDAASNNGIERVKVLLEETLSAPPLSRYKVFIIDECHVLTTETWNALLKILEEPPMNVVFILITTDPDRLPRTAVSRCQKFPFPKIKDSEIVKRLQELASLENLELDPETLRLIASRSDGSLRDAETTLDQLSLLGQNIDPLTVYELVGSASDERMLALLDSALLADTVNTVRRARELVDSGVEPLSLMSRLATLITDVLAGSYKFTDKQRRGFFRRQTFSDEKLERLRMAMKVLSEAEKQLRVSNDRTTWLTAALLQLGPDRSFMFPASCAGTSVTQSPVALDDVGDNEVADFEHRSAGRQAWDDDANVCQNLGSDFLSSSKLENASNGNNNESISMKPSTQGPHWSIRQEDERPAAKPQAKLHSIDRPSNHCESPKEPIQAPEEPQTGAASSFDSLGTLDGARKDPLLSPERLDDIWSRVVEGCRPLPLRQLLYAHGKLLAISLSEVDAVVHLEFCHLEHKSRCDRSRKSISNVFEAVLGFPVEIRISLASLPAEEQPGTRNRISGQFRPTQGPVKRSNVVAGSDSRIPVEDVPLESNALNSWGNQGGTMKRNVAHQPNAAKCFPAIPQASFGSASKQNQCFETTDSNWNSNSMPCVDIRGRSGMGADAKFQSGEQFENAWVHEARKFPPLPTSACENLTDAIELQGESLHQDGARRIQQPTSLQDISKSVNGYRQDSEYNDGNDLSSDDLTEIDELDVHSPQSHKVATLCDEVEEECQHRHGSIEGSLDSQSYSIDGPRSSDADLQKRKGSTLKMVRRLTMRSRIRSLPSSDQNSPEERGSSLKVPRFVTKNQIMSQKSKDMNLSVDAADPTEQLADSMDASSNAAAVQKRSKLKGAAGSFARFFKGSLPGK